jgi:hypothetical protein
VGKSWEWLNRAILEALENPLPMALDERDVALTGLHVQPRLAVGDVSARQALILLMMKNQMLHPTAPTARRRLSPGENAPPGVA